MEKLIEALKDFGMSEYESKVLLTLIAKGELTAKEIADFSGVPRTSVYEVVRALTERGIVEASGKPLKFRSIESRDLMKLFSRKLQENMDILRKELPTIEDKGIKVEEKIKFYTGDLALNALEECVESSREKIIAAAPHLDEQMKEMLKNARCKVVIIAGNVRKGDLKSADTLLLKVKPDKPSVYHGMLLFDESKVAIYLKQEGNLRLLLGSGSFAEFYKLFLHSFVKDKIKK